MSKNTLLLTDTADIESTETSQSTSPQSASQQSTSPPASQSSSQSTLQSTLQLLSQRRTKIRKINVFEFSDLYLPVIVVIYLLL
jgi:hypothetical protein